MNVAPPKVGLVDWHKMGRRERVFAVLLALKRGWRVERVDWQYDAGQDTVVVSVPGKGQTWSRVRHELSETLELIERRFHQRAEQVEEWVRG